MEEPSNLLHICMCLCVSRGVGGGDRERMTGGTRKGMGRGGVVGGGLGDPRPDVEHRFQTFHLVSSRCLLLNFKLKQTVTISHSGYLR